MDVSVHQAWQGGKPHAMVLVHECLGYKRDTHDTINAHSCAYDDMREGASHSYHPHRGGCYDSGEDRSPSPSLLGP